MKKLIIVCLFILIMTGCKESSIEYLEIIDSEIPVCQESCVTDPDAIQLLLTDYSELVDTQMLVIDEHLHDFPSQLSRGTSYSKDELSRVGSLIEINFNSILRPYKDFYVYFSQLYSYISFLSKEDVISPFKNVDYGFDDDSGFYKHISNSGTDSERIEDFKFNITDNDLQYEFIVYSTIDNSYHYTSFQKNIYTRYIYTSESIYSFLYVNIDTHEIVEYSLSDQDEYVNIYDPVSNDAYKMFNSNYEIAHFKDMEFVASLRNDDTGYPIQFSLYFTNGWNNILYGDPSVVPYSTLYNNENRIFEDYDINVQSLNGIYYNINALMTLSETQLEDYLFPTEFEGNISISELKNELDNFMSLENPLDLIGLTPTLIQTQCIKISEMLTDEYK